MAEESILLESIETPGYLGNGDGSSRTRLYIPSSRVADCFSARQVCLRLLDNDRLRARERAKVQGMLDGNVPFDPNKLRTLGQAWRSNLNFMEGYSNLQKTKTPYYALIAGVPYYAEIRTLEGGTNVDLWSKIITEEFTAMIKEWPDFSFQMQKAQQEMLKFGIGPALMPDPYDWRFQALRHRDLLVPEHAPASITKWAFCAIRTEMAAMDLWDKVRPENAEDAAEIGWDIDTTRLAVQFASRDIFNGRLTWDGRNWEAWQAAFKNNDIYMSLMAAESIMVYHFFVKEYSGRVSHFILSENALIDGFLFKRIDRFKDFSEFLTIFRSDVGNGDYHSIRGLGRLQYQHLECTNRLKNHLFDMAMAGTAINLQAQTQKARDELQLMQMGPVNILPPDVQLVQNRVVGFLTDAMQVDRDFTMHLNANLGTFQRRDVGYGTGVGAATRPTAMQVQQDVISTTQLTEGQMVLHFLDLDGHYRQMYLRASDPNTPDKEARAFQKRCADRGVPTIALRHTKYVRATRTAGYGSPQMRQVQASAMMPYIGMLPESGRYNWVRDQVISIAGPENVERYMPAQNFPTHDQWEANMENGVMHAGQHIMIADGQKHAVHADVHLTACEQMLKMADGIYESAPLQTALGALIKTQQFVNICLPHTLVHIQLLANDPLHRQEMGALQTRLNAIKNNMQQINAVVEQAQEHMAATAQQQQSAQTQDQIKMAQAQNEIAIDRAMAAAKIKNQQMKTMSQVQTSQQKAAAKVQSERQRMQSEVAQAPLLTSPLGAGATLSEPELGAEEIPFA
jgi:hypothetical protein